MSARTSASRAPTPRASASACSQIGSDSAWRQATINPPASDPSAYARSGEGGSAGTSSTARSSAASPASLLPIVEEVLAEAHVEERRTVRVVRADELDRSPCELDRARGGTDVAGELGRPGAELGEVEPGELGRVRHGVPQRERPLEVRERLREAEDGLRLACRLDRRGERLRAATRRRPVRRELRRRRGPAAGELLGEPRVQLLALAGQDRRVDRLRQERVAEAEAAGRLLGDEDAVLDRLAQRLAHLALRERRDGAEQRVADVASGGRGQAQQALRRTVEPVDALQQQVAQATRELAALVARGGEELLGEEGVALGAGDDRVGQRRRQRGRRRAAASSAASSSCSSGPSSSTSAEPERRTPSASRRIRSADDGSSAR